MFALVYNCPETGVTLIAGETVERDAFPDVQNVLLTIHCPCCESAHRARISECRAVPTKPHLGGTDAARICDIRDKLQAL